MNSLPSRVATRLDRVTVARGVAIAIVLVMIWYFATTDAIRSGNPFLLPKFAEGANHFALIIPVVLSAGWLALGLSRARP